MTRKCVVLFVTVLGLAVAAATGAPAAVATAATRNAEVKAQKDPIGVSLYVPSHTKFNNTTLFQCPVINCNQGVVKSTQDHVNNFCYLPVITPWGGFWNLVHNTGNDHVGWVSQLFVDPIARWNCNLQVGTETRVTINNASLFQCPYTTCNQGVAQPSNLVVDLCWILLATPWGGYWHFVYNRANGHVGWISSRFLVDPSEGLRCR